MSTQGTVYIIDDDPIVCNAIRLLLEAEGFGAKAYVSARDFLNAIGPHETGCVVTDVRMPGMSGVELLTHIAARGLNLPVIVMTGQADVALAVHAMKQGAVDFMEKPFSDAALLDAVRKALDHNSRRQEQDSTAPEIRSRLAALSTREREVLDRLIAGKSNKCIAYELGISYRTVEVHRANLMKKTRAGSLPELVRMSIVAANSPS
ncbi:response regulator FixJ [Rhodoblastus sp.]|uniref:response regulator FixJ n=1 Tax=Rhodoblastus sp. TaxID=1962975 RepID=UPI003F97BB1A